MDDEALISFLNALQEGPHRRVLEVEIPQLLRHLPIHNVLDAVVTRHTVHVEVQGFHGIPRGDLHDFENLLRALPHLGLELSEGDNGDQTISCRSNGGEMLLTGGEIRGVHLAYHASDAEALHVVVVKGYKGAPMHNDPKEIDPIALLRDIIAPRPDTHIQYHNERQKRALTS